MIILFSFFDGQNIPKSKTIESFNIIAILFFISHSTKKVNHYYIIFTI